MAPEALAALSKDELVALVLALMEQNRALQARIAELEARLRAAAQDPRQLLPAAGQRPEAEPARAAAPAAPGAPRRSPPACDHPGCGARGLGATLHRLWPASRIGRSAGAGPCL